MIYKNAKLHYKRKGVETQELQELREKLETEKTILEKQETLNQQLQTAQIEKSSMEKELEALRTKGNANDKELVELRKALEEKIRKANDAVVSTREELEASTIEKTNLQRQIDEKQIELDSKSTQLNTMNEEILELKEILKEKKEQYLVLQNN